MADSRSVQIPRHPRYAIVRKLGSGGTGSVYLGRDRLDGRREIALKVCHHEIAPEQVLREFRILRELRHPGIARALDFGRLPGSGRTYFTMEYIAGPSLEKESAALRARARRGSLEAMLDVSLQITTALRYLHNKGLLHLDIKPANVVFSEGQVKLIDFGLFQNIHLQDTRRSRGTAYYTAPEVWDGAVVDARADLYSLGVSLYRSFTGEHPFAGRSLAEIAERHHGSRPRPPRGLPDDLSRIIMKLLAKSPRHRFQSTEELLQALRTLRPRGSEPRSWVLFQEPDFVGRKRELDTFFTWLDLLRKGQGARLLLVSGEAGMGKSRFTEACITEILGLGLQVVTVPSFSEKDHDGLRRIVEKVLTLYPISGRRRARFRFLLTSLGFSAHAESRKEILQLDLDQIRARVFQETIDLFSVSIRQPVVLVLEDLHRADPQLLDFLRRFTEAALPTELQGKLGILGTYCPAPDAAQNWRLVEKPDVPTVRLKRLNRMEVTMALEGLRPALGSRTVSRLATSSRGSPGLLVHLLHHTLPEGPVKRGRPPSSGDVGSYLGERLSDLTKPERSVLLFLTLLDRPARETLVRELADLSRGASREARCSLERAGLLKGDRNGFFLGHHLLGERVLGEVSSEVLRVAQERVGFRLLKDRRRLRDAALHLLRAERVREGLAAAQRAGIELLGAGRVEEALALYSEALQHAVDPELQLFFLEGQGDLQEKCGRFHKAGKSYDLLLEKTDLSQRDRLRVLRKRGGVHLRSGNSEAARQTFEEALEILEEADDLEEHLYLLNELAGLCLFRKEFSRCTTFANRGLEMLRLATADQLTRQARAVHALNFHSAVGHILLRQFEYDRAIGEFSRGLELAEQVGTLANTALILNNLGIAYHQSNRLSEALRVYRQATALARRMGDETALFSLQCNVAVIRSRLGQMRDAAEVLGAVEEMPHPRRSKRARLFFVHSKGLVERLALGDARDIWEESIRLADELPDPLFASYGRVYLAENEISHGRWEAAREAFQELEAIEERDARLDQAIVSRRAYLEALCGHQELARSLVATALAGSRSDQAVQRLDHGQLWEEIILSCALMELGEIREAKARLRRVKRVFDRSRQRPGSLECSLLLAELSLRRRDPGGAVKRLGAARKTLSLHDTNQGSRMAAFRIPFLEARAGMQTPRATREEITERLADATGGLPFAATCESFWLLDLVSLAHKEPGAKRRFNRSRDRFVGRLSPQDRKSYLGRDHSTRLGLAGGDMATKGDQRSDASLAAARLQALGALRRLRDPEKALDVILEGSRAGRGAIFLHREKGKVGPSRLERVGKASRERLRKEALRVGFGPLDSGSCAEISAPGRRRLGVLYVEAAPEDMDRELAEFLQLAGQILAGVLTAPPSRHGAGPDTTALLIKESAKTQTLVASTFAASESPRMRELLKLIRRTRDSRLPVILTGESGVGKDHLARWIHSLSPCAGGPFLKHDCSTIPEGLLEADLFGHEAGAFTGAQRARHGYLAAADGGTFYLDNVDSLPLETQTKFLRILEERQFRPLGSQTTLKVNVRFITSTQRDLKELSSRGDFRADLYYRLAGISLTVPPLRQRAEDIPLLLVHFQRQLPGGALEFTPEAMDALKGYAWPGNVRELENVVRRLALTAEAPLGRPEVLHALGIEGSPSAFPRWIFEERTYEEILAEVKREHLLYLFERFEGNINLIARELGTTRRNVYLRFARAGLRPDELRSRREGS